VRFPFEYAQTEITAMIAAAFFTASIAFVCYVLAGYPLLLAIVAKAFPRHIQKHEWFPRVSVVVPVRNGSAWVEPKIRSLLASDYPANLLDVLIVSDGSTDGTDELVSRYPDARVALLALPPGGKAIAVTRGLAQVQGEIVVLTDVRQEFDPAAIKKLVACFAEASVGVATGELVIREGNTLEEQQTGLYWRYEKWIRRNLNRVDAMLGATGSIYAIRRELARAIPPGTLLDDVFLPFTIAFQGYRIYFECDAKAFDLPTGLETEFWRKVRTQAGVYQIIGRFPRLLWPGNRRFVHFMSHKVGRLLLPFALLIAFFSSLALPWPYKWLAIAAQALFYGMALLDRLLRNRTPLKRITAVVRAFVVLVAAAGCAVVVFFLPATTLWRETRVEQARSPEASALR
jgi:cellulose synthase/poly-beta-1,6-N-acetylglucosamine synthase-like glycosyltransferase